MPKLVASGLNFEEFHQLSSQSSMKRGLNIHFSRIEKIVSLNQGGGGGMLSTNSNKKGETKKILKNISGEAKAGEILAIMGPSGGGKTTLLDVLAGRGAYQGGSVTINKKPLSKDMKRSVGYVMQSDLFFEHLTVRASLTYTALLRLPGTYSRDRKVKEVEQVIQRLRLGSCADTPICLVSGGEKKRTNIGTEILTNPRILLLDEPTSGLDSTSAVALLKTLRSLALEGRTILTSIHQPSSGVFASFDRLLLLADGCMVYYGTPKHSLAYFSDLGFPCPKGYNAADHCMDLLVVDSATQNSEGITSTRNKLISAWDSEKAARSTEASRDRLNMPQDLTDFTKQKQKYESTYFNQVKVLTHRCLQNSRSALFTWINLLKSIGLAIIVGFCWFQMKDTEKYVRDKTGFIFFSTIYWIFDAMFESMMAFPGERAIMNKERNSGSYNLSAYFLSKTISEIPCRMLMPLLYIFITYPMTNMRAGILPFLGFAISILLGVLTGESFGLLVGTTVMDFENALVTLLLVSLGLMLGGGYYVENVPAFYQWVQYISPFKYAFHACVIIEFSGTKTSCDGSGVVADCDGNNYGSVNGDQIADFYSVQGSLGFNYGLQIVLFAVVRLLAYIALRVQKPASRG